MKKVFLGVLFVLTAFISHAQVNQADAAKALQLVDASKAEIGLSADDLKNVIVSTSYFDKSNGLTMVYLQQTYQGVPILKQILPLAFKNGKLVSKAGAFVHNMDQLADVKSGRPATSASSAVQYAISDRKLTSSKMPVVINTKENGRKVEFSDMGVSEENITAELLWVPVEETINEGKSSKTIFRMRLAWQVYIIQTTSSDYWLVCIDAMDNKTVRVDNLTVYDHWGHEADSKPGKTMSLAGGQSKLSKSGNDLFGIKDIFSVKGQLSNSPSAVNSSAYRVIPYPAESPAVAAPAVKTNSWLDAPGDATTLGWHTGLAAAEYDYTRGNNVWAYQDRVAPTNTGTIAKSASSTTALPNLTFDFVPNFSVDPLQETPVPNKQFNVTNLFYWNNIIHDVMYQYGFDEPAHNFQDDNLGRGGVGNDHVNAEAQDGSGTNNANFSTPNDGGSGRMQMYLFNLNGVNPNRDGDVDNGIVVHEYGHGISIRLTGGGATTCLSGAEQMGEGWSDYYALMFTTNWATATPTDGFNINRHMGSYALNNVSIFSCPYTAPVPPCTAAPNLGIRHFPYSTNMAVNPWVYAAAIPSSVHDRGEIWAATLWDMTWKLIEQRGISTNLYDGSATGGNVIAMKLVTTGLKLQPCSVGFIDGRDAILAADQALYGGANQCLIWEAFARRGMGYSASQGSSGSVTDQTPAFDLAPACLTEPYIVADGSAITAESCSSGNNAIDPNETVTVDLTLFNLSTVGTTNLVATLQATGGVTNPGAPQNYGVVVAGGGTVTRPFTFTAGNLACGDMITATLQLQDGATNLGTITYTFVTGALIAAFTENFDAVTAPALPAGWLAINDAGTSPAWVTSSTASVSAPNSIFVDDPAVVSLRSIETPSIAVGAAGGSLSFQNSYVTESGFDGGVLEISINGGAYEDIITAGGTFTAGGYNATLSSSFSNPLPGRMAWSGNSSGFITSTVELPATAAGQNVKLKFRMGSDASVSSTGWRIDNVTLSERVCCTGATCTTPTLTATNIGPVNNDANTCGASVTMGTNLTVTGDPVPTVTYSLTNFGATIANPYTFPVGTTTVWAKASNTCGDDIKSFTVTVVDAQPPVITCPGNITVPSDPGVCGAVVNYPAPTVTDNCGGASAALNISQSTNSTTVVQFTSVTCNQGGINRGNRHLRKYDLSTMALSGPYTINKINWGVERASSFAGTKAGGDKVSSGISANKKSADNSFANSGGANIAQTITLNVYTLSGAFTFANMTLVASEPVVIDAQTNTLISTTLSSPPTVPADAILVLEINQPDGFPNSTSFFPACNNLGQSAPTYIAAAVCSINEPTDLVALGFPNSHLILNAEGVVNGAANITQTAGLPSGSFFPEGVTTNTFEAMDEAGNPSTCSFTVTVSAGPACCVPVITCPPNITVGNAPGLCSQVVTYNMPTVVDNCNYVCQAPTSIANYTYLGEYGGHRYFRSNFSRTWNSANANALGVGAHLVTITSAAEAAFLTANYNVFSWTGLTDQVTEGTFEWVTGEPFVYSDWRAGDPNGGTAENYVARNFYGAPQWVDMPQYTNLPFVIEFDCEPRAIQTAGIPSGATYPVGVTTNTFSYTSSGGSTVTCSFTVTVNDTELPVLSCPANIVVPGSTPQVVNYSSPTLSDNCLPACTNPTSIATYTYLGNFAGHTYFISNFSRNWSAANAAAMGVGGHLLTLNTAAERNFVRSATTTFAWIGLTDEVSEGNFKWVTNEPFTFSDWRAGEPNGGTSENYVAMNFYGNREWVDMQLLSYLPFIVEFECTNGIVQTAGLPSGSAFPVGVTTNTFEYTDGGSNTGTCSFTVTVENTTQTFTAVDKADQGPTNTDFSVAAYPNPSASAFTIMVNSESDQPVQVRILDVNGKVHSSSRVQVTKGGTFRVGENLTSGTWYAEITQGDNRKVVRLYKIK